MDLGETIPKGGDSAIPAAPRPDSKTSDVRYPQLYLDGKTAKDFIAEHNLDLGDYVEGNVRLCVISLRKDEYGHGISFNVETLDDIKVTDEEDESTDGDKSDEEEKILGYKRTASAAKETPDLSAKDLE